MSIEKTIVCDECGARKVLDAIVASRTVREYAARTGWTRADGKDRCPQCTTKNDNKEEVTHGCA